MTETGYDVKHGEDADEEEYNDEPLHLLQRCHDNCDVALLDQIPIGSAYLLIEKHGLLILRSYIPRCSLSQPGRICIKEVSPDERFIFCREYCALLIDYYKYLRFRLQVLVGVVQYFLADIEDDVPVEIAVDRIYERIADTERELLYPSSARVLNHGEDCGCAA
ncbi:hypothetical protein SDC9_157702 [bioreactor metagenome]|uniref:Uncharacterized protein n=1 Tax=bioreactor metagenome TaxID=1076179 RepID=A0A645F849_9ZZZZ